ncbi:MAG: S8 family serine peptidase [Streptococcaceae bacterium]|jgi:subtilisin family serine protease|nr:S8 family serine peptidase [Streptococcaceae bacterium]
MKKKSIKFITSVLLASNFLPLTSVTFADAPTTVLQSTDPSNKTAEELLKDAYQKEMQGFGKLAEKAIAQQLRQNQALNDDSPFSLNANLEENVRVIVHLSEKPAVDETPAPDGTVETINAIKQGEQEVIESQESIQHQVEGITKKKVIEEFGYLVNGFSIECKVGDIDKIRALQGVSNVEVATLFKPTEYSTNEILQAKKVWEDYSIGGNGGEGTVIADIDTGFDIHNKDFHPLDDSTTKLKQADVQKFILSNKRGTYVNSKIPFAFSYGVGENDVKGDNDHGMHVAGIMAANGEGTSEEEKLGSFVQGVAPKAQVIAMQIANDDARGEMVDDAIIKAVEDSVSLGADVLNLSLGSSSELESNSFLIQAIRAASDQGVIPVIAAGNDGRLSAFSNDNDDSFWNQEEDGTLGSPGVSMEGLTVASCENQATRLTKSDFTINGKSLPTVKSTISLGFEGLDQVGLVALPLAEDSIYPKIGVQEDYSGVDVKGKVVIVSRGGGQAFVDKASIAKKHGAIGILIVNNSDDETEIPNGVTVSGLDLPTVYISKAGFKDISHELKDENNVCSISKEYCYSVVESTNDMPEMSEFSSWGPSPSLELKPEITAPGGNILSTMNDNKYAIESGTSMATPAVSGAMAILTKQLKEKYPATTGKHFYQLAKAVLMNNAKIITKQNKDGKEVIVSPRKQGAGLVQVENALKAEAVLLDETDGNGSFAEKEVGHQFDLLVKIQNLTDKEETYHFDPNKKVFTEKRLDSKTLEEVQVPTSEITNKQKDLTIPPHQSVTDTITVNVGDLSINSFAEGFISYTSDDGLKIQAPFMGYFGDYSSGRNIEPPKTDLGAKSFGEDNNIGTYFSDGKNFLGLMGASEDKYECPIIDPQGIAISPNRDGNGDLVFPILSLRRGLTSLKAKILNDKNQLVTTLFETNGVRKSHYDFHIGNYTFFSSPGLLWDGASPCSDDFDKDNIDFEYKSVTSTDLRAPDGNYKFQIESTNAGPSARPQVDTFNIQLDTKGPKMTDLNYYSEIKNNKRVYHVKAKVSDEFTGFNEVTPILLSVNGASVVTTIEEVSQSRELDLTLTDEQVNAFYDGKNKITLAVMDRAQNITSKDDYVDLDPDALSIDLKKDHEIPFKNLVVQASKKLDVNKNEIPLYNKFERRQREGAIQTNYGLHLTGYYAKPGNLRFNGKSPDVIRAESYEVVLPVKDSDVGNNYSVVVEDVAKNKVVFSSVNRICEEADARFIVLNPQRYSYPDDPENIREKKAAFYTEVDSPSVVLPFLAGKNNNVTFYNADLEGEGDGNHFFNASADEVNYPEFDLAEGLNCLSAKSYHKGENGEDQVAKDIFFSAYTNHDKTFPNFENIGAQLGANVSMDKHEQYFNFEKGTYTVKVVLRPSEYKSLKILGYHNDLDASPLYNEYDDPRNNVDLSQLIDGESLAKLDRHYNYELPVGEPGNIPEKEFRCIPFEATRWDGSVVRSSLVLQWNFNKTKMVLKNKDASQTDIDTYELYTNKKELDFNVGLTSNNFEGLRLRLNSRNVFEERDYGEFAKQEETHEKEVNLPIQVQQHVDGSECQTSYNLALFSRTGAEANKVIIVHSKTSPAAKPIITQNTNKATTKAVILKTSQEAGATSLYSFDGVHFTQMPENGIICGANVNVYFKSLDRYGNESPVVTHTVKNVFHEALKSKANVVKEKNQTSSVSLSFEANANLLLKEVSHLQYSTDAGKTWATYTKPVNLTKSLTFYSRVKDDLGQVGETLKTNVQVVTTKPAAVPSAKPAAVPNGKPGTVPSAKPGAVSKKQVVAQPIVKVFDKKVLNGWKEIKLTLPKKQTGSIQYSVNQGKKWTTYKKKFTLKSTTLLKVRTRDSKGHFSKIKLAKITIHSHLKNKKTVKISKKVVTKKGKLSQTPPFKGNKTKTMHLVKTYYKKKLQLSEVVSTDAGKFYKCSYHHKFIGYISYKSVK